MRKSFVAMAFGLAAVLIGIGVFLWHRHRATEIVAANVESGYLDAGQPDNSRPICVVFVHGIFGDDTTWGKGKTTLPGLLMTDHKLSSSLDIFLFEYSSPWLGNASAAGFGLSKPAKFRQGRNGIVPYWEAPLTLDEKTNALVPSVICVGPNDDMDAATLAVITLLDSKGLLPFIGKRKVELLTSKTPYRP
jgi:hypothetical protein